MSISLEKIYYTAMRKYGLQLVAGKMGIWNLVSWIHLVEDVQVADFLKGQELVVITGIGRPNEEQLLEYTKRLYKNEASGLIVNIGPYIQKIPESVIDFAENHDFPVFDLPWRVHLVDFNREFCNMIIQNDQEEQNLCSAFQNAIFSPKAQETWLPTLRHKGISPDDRYCMIKCMPIITCEEGYDATRMYYDLRQHFERILNITKKHHIIFRHDIYITILVSSVDRQMTDEIIERCRCFGKWRGAEGKLYFAVSKYKLKIPELSEYYHTLDYMCKLSQKEGRIFWHWEDLGEWNIIFSVPNPERLKEYRNITIGELERFDAENGTHHCDILDKYLKLNGSMADVAAECFIHRNTVSYYLKKIEDILHCDIYSMRDRVSLYLALRIKEILEL